MKISETIIFAIDFQLMVSYAPDPRLKSYCLVQKPVKPGLKQRIKMLMLDKMVRL